MGNPRQAATQRFSVHKDAAGSEPDAPRVLPVLLAARLGLLRVFHAHAPRVFVTLLVACPGSLPRAFGARAMGRVGRSPGARSAASR